MINQSILSIERSISTQVDNTPVAASGFYPLSNPSGFITGIENLVYTTGDQTISGIKTFTNNVTILGNFAVSGTTFINEVIDVTTTGVISGVTGVFQYLEADNIVYSETTSSVVVQPGDDILAKYLAAKALRPNGSAKSSTNRASLIIFPGTYTLSAELAIDEQFIDVIGLGAQTQKPVVLISGNTLSVTADDVRISGISVGTQRFYIAGNKPLQVFENCVGGESSFNVGREEHISGTFISCIAGDGSFNAGVYGGVNGVFTGCIAGNYSFAGLSYGLANGTFTNCTGGNYCFGGSFATGTFTDCVAGNTSFGAWADYGAASGIFTNCTAGNYSFAGQYGGGASGTFMNCTAGGASFAGYFGVASGKFLNCVAGAGSFGGLYSLASGTFMNCTAGAVSFGLDNSSANGVFFNCRVTGGEFPTPSVRVVPPSFFPRPSPAIMVNCMDGNGNIIEGEASE